MPCCNNTYNLGCAYSCGNFVLPFNATQNGLHTIEIYFGGLVYQKTINGVIGTPFILDMSVFNETGCSTFKIIQPDMTYFNATISSVEYDCFSVKLNILMNVPAVNECNMDYVECDYWELDYSE